MLRLAYGSGIALNIAMWIGFATLLAWFVRVTRDVIRRIRRDGSFPYQDLSAVMGGRNALFFLTTAAMWIGANIVAHNAR